MVNDGGRVTALSAASGKVVFEQERLDADGEYFASPVAAASHVYFVSNRGVVSVIEAGPELRVSARNDLTESITATPALADDRLYVRSAEHLWSFGLENKGSDSASRP